MSDIEKRAHIDLNNLDSVQDIDAMRAALRSALEQTRSDASRLRVWESKAEELEGSRRGFLSLMSQLSESRRLAAEATEAKKAAENKARLLELEKDACRSRLQEWENKAADFENLRKNAEDRENRNRVLEKTLIEQETAFEQRALSLSAEYARKRKELDEFKERMRGEVNELKAHDGRSCQEKETTP